LGVEFDPWQHGLGSIALGKREDGKYAATVGGVVMSIPRQVGKTFLVGMIVIALCLLFPGLTVLWTAHRTRTATKTFHTLKGMTERAKVKPFMLLPRLSNGEQEIRFRNGSVIMFGAREQGFGRGFDEVDIEVFDEAQILSEKALEDMIPATNQSRQPSGALLFFMGTPPRPGDPSEEFSNRRSSALAGQTEDMFYVEMSADKDADLDDRKQWAKANPSYPHRTPEESMKRMRANLTDDDSFRREGLGIWDDPITGGSGITTEMWAACGNSRSELIGTPVLTIDSSPNRWSAICLAGRAKPVEGEDPPPEPRTHVEVPWFKAGTDWVVPEVVRLIAEYGISSVSLDPTGPAGAFLPALEAEGIEVTALTMREMGQSCAMFFNAVSDGMLRHLGNDDWLNLAIAGAIRRPLGDLWAWARKTSLVDIAPLVAATIAVRAAAVEVESDPGIYLI
jgi:phage terminase large subunit-like protein